MDLRRCLSCGSRQIQRVCETIRVGLGKRRRVVPGVPFERCEACGEVYYDHRSLVVIERKRRAERKAVR